MTEYIIIVALIAIAAIAAFSYFGKSIRTQTAAMSESVAGDSASATSTISKGQSEIKTGAEKETANKDLKTYAEDSAKAK